MNNFLIGLNKYIFGVLFLLLSVNLWGWTTGFAPSDRTDSVGGIFSCSIAAEINASENDSYRKGGGTCVTVCHRWGLKWEGNWDSGSPQCKLNNASTESWEDLLNNVDPDGSGSTRLPTIKELVRIFDYSSISSDIAMPAGSGVSGGFKGTIFRSWLQAENRSVTFVDGYLISSTYRNIAADGTNGDSEPKILGIEIETGKVVAFDQDLKLCGVLNTSGECANSTVENIYAFKVSELPQ